MADAGAEAAAAVPPLADWLRWVAEMPAAFQHVPEGFTGGRVRVRAVVADLMETLLGGEGGEGGVGGGASDTLLGTVEPAGATKAEQNRLRWALAACHVLWHPAFRAAATGLSRAGMEKLFAHDLAALAVTVPVATLASDEERREELVRRVLGAAGLRLPGETAAQAADRLKQVDSVERRRVLLAAAERERRARQVREMMARKAAEEAAAKVSRE